MSTIPTSPKAPTRTEIDDSGLDRWIDFLTHMPLGGRIIIAAIVAHIVVLAFMSNKGE